MIYSPSSQQAARIECGFLSPTTLWITREQSGIASRDAVVDSLLTASTEGGRPPSNDHSGNDLAALRAG